MIGDGRGSPAGAVFDPAGKRIWVAGHRGLLGSAIVRRLASERCEVLTIGRESLDLTDQHAAADWIAAQRFDAILMAAGVTGGLGEHKARPATFLTDNLMIQANVLNGARVAGVPRLVTICSAAVYPQHAEQPMPEEALLGGPQDEAHQPYASAMVAALMLARSIRQEHGLDYVAVLPTNLYGPGVRFEPERAHVIPSLVARIAEAKREGAPEIVVWGTGAARRDFLFVDDCAEACVAALRGYSADLPLNIGSGTEVTIRTLAEELVRLIGYEGALRFDPTKPEGAARRSLAIDRLTALGWAPRISLIKGLARTVADYEARRPA